MKSRKAIALLVGVLLGLSWVGSAQAMVRVTAAGSTALLPLMKAAGALYARQHPDIEISVSGGGSSSGITQVAAGAIDIGDSDLALPRHSSLVDHRIAVVGFALIVHPDVRLRSLTQAQIAGIFSGSIVNWRALGGPNELITVVNRPRSSGTRSVFRREMMHGAQIADSALTVDASGTVVETVSSTPGAISYVALSALTHSHLQPLALDGVVPTPANIASGRYPLWSYEHLLTAGPNPTLDAFIAFVAQNRSLLRSMHYLALSEMHVVKNDR